MRPFISLALLALAACATPASQPSASASYRNPVLDSDFPDPAVLRASDGYYYDYATQGEHDGWMLNIQVARSRDLVTWERLGDARPEKPAWASRTQDFWATGPARALCCGAALRWRVGGRG
jgi:arabinan endo-1,5-alpha-L-arabinosidase